MPHPTEKTVPCADRTCPRLFCCNMHMGRHNTQAHGAKTTPRLTTTRKRRQRDLADDLIGGFRRLLKEAQTTYGLIEKLTADREALQVALRSSEDARRVQGRELANLRGKLLHSRQQVMDTRRSLKREVNYVPLEDRLTSEEKSFLATIMEGRR